MNTEDYTFDRVMIVDDTQIDRYVASYMMKKHHFAKEIIEFDMATKAIDFLEQNQENAEKLPQIIILDIRMPEMDGFQFLERLSVLPKSIKKSCCIIMLSTSLDPHDHERAENNPVVKKFLNKPLSKANLEDIYSLYIQSNMKDEVEKDSNVA